MVAQQWQVAYNGQERHMTKKVFKYRLTTPKTTVEMPAGAEILRIDLQQGVPTIWALVDPDETASVERRFDIVGTGWDVPEDSVYRATYFDREGDDLFPNGFVWHVFEV